MGLVLDPNRIQQKYGRLEEGQFCDYKGMCKFQFCVDKISLGFGI